jgi:hypothetical protein
MTAITFPTDPANDELYTAPNGCVYIWDGEKWVVNSTIYTGPALENISQDRVAPMFVNGVNTGITFAYDSTTNTLTSTVTAGISVADFGEGFSLDNADKIVTNKLYSTNQTQPTQHYRLEVDTNGVVILPDQSIINGATLKTVPGNWAGITAGPASPAGKDEDSWVWVDNDGATIATKYSTDNYQWKFNNTGTLTFPDGFIIDTSTFTNTTMLFGAPNGEISTKNIVLSTGEITNTISIPGTVFDVATGAGNTDPVSISGKNGVGITTGADGLAHTQYHWTFGTDGTLAYPNTALQRDTNTVTCAGNASTVVYTASGQYQHTIRLLIQVEGSEGAPEGWDTQSCEMIIAKSFRADDVAATVYGVVHTSVAPLATFTAEWNALTSRVEVLCATPSANDVYVRTFATEITTAD